MTVDIANRLVEMRKKHGYSQEKLAEMLGLSRQAVSKWERAEASPDTDNLILLSRLYGVSLDELLNTDAADDAFVNHQQAQEDRTQEKAADNKRPYVDIGPGGIHVIDAENGDEVHVSWKGIHVNEKGGNKVSIGPEGVYADEEARHHVGERGRVVINGVDYSDGKWKKSIWTRIPLAIIALIAIVLISYFQGTFHPYWLLLFAIPIIDSIVKAIYYKDIHLFAFPLVAVVSFLFVGFQFGLWHPGWVIFLTIPIWYSLLPRRKRKEGDEEDEYEGTEWDD